MQNSSLYIVLVISNILYSIDNFVEAGLYWLEPDFFTVDRLHISYTNLLFETTCTAKNISPWSPVMF